MLHFLKLFCDSLSLLINQLIELPREDDKLDYMKADFLFYSSFMQYITIPVSPAFIPPNPTPTYPLPQAHFVSIQKREGLPVLSTKHGIMRCNETGHTQTLISRLDKAA